MFRDCWRLSGKGFVPSNTYSEDDGVWFVVDMAYNGTHDMSSWSCVALPSFVKTSIIPKD